MTDKIKSAREAVIKLNPRHGKPVSDAEYEQYSINCVTAIILYYQTILKALSAYEKLQGVDEMKKSYPMKGTNQAWLEGYNQAIDDVKARLIADIGGDGR